MADVELTWRGKPERIERRVLPLRAVGDAGSSTGWTNLLIHADNRVALASLAFGPRREAIDAAGGVRLIYIDPPFDSGADYGDFHDAWDRPAYLTMMYERLVLMRDLLAADGTLVVHCDWRANAQVRCMLDELFGPEAFANEIIWHYGGPSPLRTAFARKHDTLLVVRRDPARFRFEPQFDALPEYLQGRARTDPDGRQWVDQNLGKLRPETIERMKAEGRVFTTRAGKLRRKQFLDEMDGAQLDDVWNIPIINSQAREALGYATQKPRALLERVIRAFSRPGDLVADFFCGSGTTLAVSEAEGRPWIGCDAGDQAIEITRERLEAAGSVFEVLEPVETLETA